MKKKYDWIIVGSGLFGATFAYRAKKDNKKCLVIDKREHFGGNIYCENNDGIYVHKYGCHIFHTNDRKIWDFVNRFCDFEPYILQTIANNDGKLYNLPFNMNTFFQLWGVTTPQAALEKLNSQRIKVKNPRNLEEQALALVGHDVYEFLIKGYTEKQWGRKCCDLPASIINRLPIRFTFDNNYFNDKYQGIPKFGYNALIDGLLYGIEAKTCIDFMKEKKNLLSLANNILYTGQIDEFFDYKYGALQYRSVRFEQTEYKTSNYQGCAVINYTDKKTPYTRSIEHRLFDRNCNVKDRTIISREYSNEWNVGIEPYYPINNIKNNGLYEKYISFAKTIPNVVFGGRLGAYRYYDMDDAIENAILVYNKINK